MAKRDCRVGHIEREHHAEGRDRSLISFRPRHALSVFLSAVLGSEGDVMLRYRGPAVCQCCDMIVLRDR